MKKGRELALTNTKDFHKEYKVKSEPIVAGGGSLSLFSHLGLAKLFPAALAAHCLLVSIIYKTSDRRPTLSASESFLTLVGR